MPWQMNPIDQQLLNEMQARFPLVPAPFAELAARIGTDEAGVIARLSGLRGSGVLRQVSAIFDTLALGYQSSLVAMRIPEERFAAAAAAVNAHPGVSHNYRRMHAFNMWFTIAVPPGSDLQAHIEALHRLAHADSTRMLPTLHLFKIGVTLDMTGERPIDDISDPGYTDEQQERALGNGLTRRDIEVIRVLQGDLALEPHPFAAAARALDTTVDELIEELRELQKRGYLRRFAAIVRHRQAGFIANAMVVWNVPEDTILEIGQAMARYTAISHCYQRPTYEDWPYNLFTMIHARNESECEEFVALLAERHGLADYAPLYSNAELKKVRLVYFTPEIGTWERRHLSDGQGRRASI
jgi:DNA-binding Lrp family transcriptional regulator